MYFFFSTHLFRLKVHLMIAILLKWFDYLNSSNVWNYEEGKWEVLRQLAEQKWSKTEREQKIKQEICICGEWERWGMIRPDACMWQGGKANKQCGIFCIDRQYPPCLFHPPFCFHSSLYYQNMIKMQFLPASLLNNENKKKNRQWDGKKNEAEKSKASFTAWRFSSFTGGEKKSIHTFKLFLLLHLPLFHSPQQSHPPPIPEDNPDAS